MHLRATRKIAIIENGTWAPNARKRILAILEEAKGLEILENGVTIRSAMTEENKKEIELLAKELCK